MCRIAYIPKDFKVTFTRKLLEHLEKSFGGHGNGIAFWNHKGKAILEKGVSFSINQCMEFMKKHRKNCQHGFVFHTRYASVGVKSDSNCHPFADSKLIFCQNGHFTGYKELALLLRFSGIKINLLEISDARVLFEIARKLDDFFEFVEYLDNASSTLLFHYYNSKPIVIVNSNGFQFAKYKNRYYYASDFPANVKSFEFSKAAIVQLLTSKKPDMLHGDFSKATHYYVRKGGSAIQSDISDYYGSYGINSVSGQIESQVDSKLTNYYRNKFKSDKKDSGSDSKKETEKGNGKLGKAYSLCKEKSCIEKADKGSLYCLKHRAGKIPSYESKNARVEKKEKGKKKAESKK